MDKGKHLIMITFYHLTAFYGSTRIFTILNTTLNPSSVGSREILVTDPTYIINEITNILVDPFYIHIISDG